MRYITHSQFVEEYNKGNLSVSVDKSRAGDFVLSEFSETRYKFAHNFWTWLGIALTVPGPIALLFVSWKLAVPSFFVGLVIISAARKSAAQFVVTQMIEREDFWDYVLLHNGAEIRDNNNEPVYSEFLKKMDDKFSN